MSAARIALVEDEWGYVDITYDYQELVETFGTILAKASDDDYQGDSLYLIDNGIQVGILTFGWGSCSGCDALQAVVDQADLDKLQDDLENGIKWFDSVADARAYMDAGGLKDSFLNDELVAAFGAALDGLSA